MKKEKLGLLVLTMVVLLGIFISCSDRSNAILGPTAKPQAAPDTTTTGFATVITDPSGAAVKVNGQAIGTSPVYDREMPTGVHIVEASLARHFSVVDTVRIRAGQRTLKSFSLSPVPPDSAQVVVYTIDASTAEVTLSGQGQLYIGQTPFSQAVVKGEYTLRVSRAGYKVFAPPAFTLAGGEVKTFLVDLQLEDPNTGELTWSFLDPYDGGGYISDASGKIATVNGRKLENLGSFGSEVLPSGTWFFTATKDGYVPKTFSAHIEPKGRVEIKDITLKLGPSTPTLMVDCQFRGAAVVIDTRDGKINGNTPFFTEGLIGQVRIEIWYEGYQTAVIDTTLIDGNMIVARTLKELLPGMGAISGIVRPIDVAGAYVIAATGEVIVKDLGSVFVVPNVKPGVYHVFGVGNGFHRDVRRAEVQAGHDTPVEMELVPVSQCAPANVSVLPQFGTQSITTYAELYSANGTRLFAGDVPDQMIRVEDVSDAPFRLEVWHDNQRYTNSFELQCGEFRREVVMFIPPPQPPCVDTAMVAIHASDYYSGYKQRITLSWQSSGVNRLVRAYEVGGSTLRENGPPTGEIVDYLPYKTGVVAIWFEFETTCGGSLKLKLEVDRDP